VFYLWLFRQSFSFITSSSDPPLITNSASFTVPYYSEVLLETFCSRLVGDRLRRTNCQKSCFHGQLSSSTNTSKIGISKICLWELFDRRISEPCFLNKINFLMSMILSLSFMFIGYDNTYNCSRFILTYQVILKNKYASNF
jgi:hypothetical protein